MNLSVTSQLRRQLRKRPRRSDDRTAEALDRTADRALRTPREQLALLDARFGVGVGAQKERARLLLDIAIGEPPDRSVAANSAPAKKGAKVPSTPKAERPKYLAPGAAG